MLAIASKVAYYTENPGVCRDAILFTPNVIRHCDPRYLELYILYIFTTCGNLLPKDGTIHEREEIKPKRTELGVCSPYP